VTEGVDLEISQDVLYGIAQLALDRLEGMRAIVPPARVGEILSGRRTKGIQIEREGNDVYVDLTVAVAYGVEIPTASIKAQRAVREAVASMTGLVVRSVNVNVDAVDLPEGTTGG